MSLNLTLLIFFFWGGTSSVFVDYLKGLVALCINLLFSISVSFFSTYDNHLEPKIGLLIYELLGEMDYCNKLL